MVVIDAEEWKKGGEPEDDDDEEIVVEEEAMLLSDDWRTRRRISPTETRHREDSRRSDVAMADCYCSNRRNAT